MALRLRHVPTIVSSRQSMEESMCSGDLDSVPAGKQASCLWWQAAQAAAAPALNDCLPLANAVGSSLPLYQYRAGAMKSPAIEASFDSDEVPVFLGSGSAWDPSIDQHLPGFDTSIKAGISYDNYIPVIPPGSSMSDTHDNNLPAMVVPVCLTSAPRRSSVARPHGNTVWTSLHLPEPYLHHSSPSDDLTSPTYSDDDVMLNSSKQCSPCSSATDMMSPRHSLDSNDMTQLSVPASRGTLDTLVTALWEDCDARGLFRYNVANCSNCVVPGPWGWVAQLNEGRSSKKRATELQVDAVLQPFDSSKFNFGRAFLKEVLLEFEELPGGPAGTDIKTTWAANNTGAQVIESNAMAADPTLVMINVSPIDYGHVLLVPHVLDQRPQQLEISGLSAALAFIRELANPTFRLGYNSLGAFATINHLHFQGYYLPHTMPCEKASTCLIPGFHNETATVSELVDYPVLGWVVDMKRGFKQIACEGDMSALIMQICMQLQALDQPFNVLFVNQGTRAFIWPQCYAERQAAGLVSEEMLENQINPAVFEVAGHLVIKRAEDFHGATDEWAQRLLAGVSLPPARFAQLTHLCLNQQQK